jgi:hypothetical protein
MLLTEKIFISKKIKNKEDFIMKKIFTLILVVTMLIVGSTTTAFARGYITQQPQEKHDNRQYQPKNRHYEPQQRQQHYRQQYYAPQRHWHRGPSTAHLIKEAIEDVIALSNDNPCEEAYEESPCDNEPIATGVIPLGSSQWIEVGDEQYVNIVFRNGKKQTFVGPRRVFGVSGAWYALFNNQ